MQFRGLSRFEDTAHLRHPTTCGSEEKSAASRHVKDAAEDLSPAAVWKAVLFHSSFWADLSPALILKVKSS